MGGAKTIKLQNKVYIAAGAAVGGKTESEGPARDSFDELYGDDTLGGKTWEKAEIALQERACALALKKCSLSPPDIDVILGGDLQAQCTATAFAARRMGSAFAGLYSACSTMALALAAGSVLISGGFIRRALAVTSSHFASAERQFRFPLEYASLRCPTAQRTATASGAVILTSEKSGCAAVESATVGRIVDAGVTDANNMGAAMAPAACDTIISHLNSLGAEAEDYDMILTGDLGFVGSELLRELAVSAHGVNLSAVHEDCGRLIFDRETQDVHAGGSGAGCSASILAGRILRLFGEKKLSRVLFVATGALLSAVTTNQNMTIPCIAHAVELTSSRL